MSAPIPLGVRQGERSGTVSPGEGGVGVGPYFHFPHPWAIEKNKCIQNAHLVEFV